MSNTKLRNVAVFSAAAIVTVLIGYFLATGVSSLIAGTKNANGDRHLAEDRTATKELGESQELVMSTMEVGDTLPDHIFEDLHRNPLQLSDMLSHITLLVFFLPNCSGCEQEIEELNKTVSEQSELRYFLFISPGNPRLIEDLQKDYRFRAPVLYDHRAAFTYDLYQIATYPFNVVIDQNRVVKEIVVGPLPQEELMKVIEANQKAESGRI